MYSKIIATMKTLKDPERAQSNEWFFKTGPGQYGEGDTFWGLTMPEQRSVAKQFFKDVKLDDVQKLLNSPIHEQRMTGLLILVYKYPKSTPAQQKQIYNFYMKNYARINNWDLVDASAHKIAGAYLLAKDRKPLYVFAKSKNLWKKRIAIIATAAFINENDLDDTFAISEILLKDNHDLIHKAVGWMLREAGKKNQKRLLEFLDTYATTMPRTMLRYSIEKLPEQKRKYYLHKK